MSLMVSCLAGQVGRPAALLAGDGEMGVLAGDAEAPAAVDAGPGAPAETVLVQLVTLMAMMASNPARAGHGTCIMITFCAVPVLVCPRVLEASDPFTSALYCNPWAYINETISLYLAILSPDIALLTLPIFPIASLRMPAKKRAGVLLLFLLSST